MLAQYYEVPKCDNTVWRHIHGPYEEADRPSVFGFTKEFILQGIAGFADPGPKVRRAIVVRFPDEKRYGDRGISLSSAIEAWGPFWHGSSICFNSAPAALAAIAEACAIDPDHLEIVPLERLPE